MLMSMLMSMIFLLFSSEKKPYLMRIFNAFRLK